MSLTGAVSLGTGVMIGAGIFALLGQVAELSGNLLCNLKNKVQFSKTIVIVAILLDAIVLTGFIWTKAKVDLPLIIVAFGLMVVIFFGEKWFLKYKDKKA